MNTILYGGIKYKKIHNAVRCKLCSETITSTYLHDYKTCACGSISIDYERVLGSTEHIEDRSIYFSEIHGKKIYIPHPSYLNNILY